MELLIPDWPQLPSHVGALSTLRAGGFSAGAYAAMDGSGGLNLGVHVDDDPERVRQNRAQLQASLPATPAWLTQVHGTQVLDAARAATAGDGAAPQADASFAHSPGSVCAIMTADCLPVLFCDAGGTIVAAAHAGWRGLAGGVLHATLAAMRANGAQEITAWLGPAIGPRNFEVGAEVRDIFIAQDARHAAAFKAVEGRPGKFLADIYALARGALNADGVTEIAGGGLCTVDDARRFYSYRRDRVTGRMATLIWLR